jgi:aldehyde:ferredoxin oxidoreductase
MGGAGFGIKILFNEVGAGTDPLGPNNKLVFSIGPFTGTSIPCSSRMAVTGKSPLTNGVGASFAGGYFPVELKFAGYDALIIEGKAEKPTYVWIKNGKVRFRDASKLWGMKTFDCQRTIKNDLKDQNIRVACIGPAGENLSRMACIVNETRAAGRKGLGAVMGSKNLKAIALRGSGSVKVASKERFKVARAGRLKAFKESPMLYNRFGKIGTAMNVDNTSALGIFPTKNWAATGTYTPVGRIGVKALERNNVGRETCYGCPVRCSHLRIARNGPYKGTLGEPEFETLYSLGGVTGVENLDSIIAADRFCDELGLDTLSAGVTISFAMELYERGILKAADVGGLELNFGNDDAMITLLQLIAFREGVGDILADGVRIGAEKIGKGADQYAMHVKGLELPGYDVRGAKAHGLGYATSYTGADHCRGYASQEIFGSPLPRSVDRFAIEGKGEITKWNEDIRMGTCDCPTMCLFVLGQAYMPIAVENTAALIEAVTGFSCTPEDIWVVGERVTNLARAFNVREGFTRADDMLPERLMTEPLKGGTSEGHFISKEDLKYMLDEYYTARGWDVNMGIPKRAKLVELGLQYVADQLNP